ncbi:1-acyl-sn-glycerol-3-phosphate acyltransferase [Actinomadura madurae]|uniref:1-acyl-sn-glycerol-3-phosphate acyltransferase n=1 Tax=Actinomadura madurae TaxID=1993 RepID=UPI0020D20DA6|nr:1-acyl-sn-glycerol-3-phosphate acyltransferase [Actinomadura madurae]MCP9968271.1 1-acyl-sn-glycerol-3-phosphate acyltransferase [Actinomadura madurae]
MVPPRVVRRLVFTPLLFLLTALVVVLFPAAYLVTSLIGRERRRARRLLWFALAWGTRESAAVVECGWLWLRGRARDDRHYDVIRRYIAGLYSMAQRQLGLRVQIDGSWDGPDGDRPLIVLSRHAGPGDALLLVHHLLSDYRRRPRVVMKAQLRLDPCIDIAAGRMPNVFVTPGGGAVEDIGRLASDLGPRDALLIFPEGGNFTPERRRRAIRRAGPPPAPGRGRPRRRDAPPDAAAARRCTGRARRRPVRRRRVRRALRARPHDDGRRDLAARPADRRRARPLVARPGPGRARRPGRTGRLAVRPVGARRRLDQLAAGTRAEVTSWTDGRRGVRAGRSLDLVRAPAEDPVDGDDRLPGGPRARERRARQAVHRGQARRHGAAPP